MHTGSAIFVDFDNVFTALWGLDEDLAMRFASNPADWLAGLAGTGAGDAPRRWLVARCYMNPSGSVSTPGDQSDRIWFYKFRGCFVQAGFEVVDCPTLARGAKNAADIRIVIDVLDLLGHRTRFEEFVFVSGDSDFTPLLHRLRAEDRRTTIISPGHLSSAYAAVAEHVMGFDRIAALLDGARHQPREPLEGGGEQGEQPSSSDEESFALLVRRRYDEALRPLNISALSHEVRREIPNAKSSEWFGKGTFRKALEGLFLPNVRFSQHMLWDGQRHKAPETMDDTALLPSAVPDIAGLSTIQG